MDLRRLALLLISCVCVAAGAQVAAKELASFPEEPRRTPTIRDISPVQVYAAPQVAVSPPRPLPPAIEPDMYWTASVEAESPPLLSEQDLSPQFDWSYRRRLPTKRLHGPGLRGARGYRAPLSVSTITGHDAWELGAENWRYSRDDQLELTLGNYSSKAPVWGSSVRLGGIAVSQGLTDGVVPEDQWQYGVMVGALDHSTSGITQGDLVYGSGAGDIVVRYGLTPELTLESEGQWAPSMVAAGMGVQYTTPNWGAWRLGLAKATRDLHDGWRYRVGYDVSLLDSLELSWLGEQRSEGFSDLSNYADFGSAPFQRSSRWQAVVPLGSWGDLVGSYERVGSATGPLKQQFGFSQQFWYSPNLRVSLNADHDRVSGDYGVGVQFSVPLP